MGSRWDAPLPPPLTSPNKCGFIAARLGRRASGVSRPRSSIISWVLSTERERERETGCRQRGRGSAKDRDDEGGEEDNMVGAFFPRGTGLAPSFSLHP